MFILEEYYPFQVLQIFAGVAPPVCRLNSKTRSIYWIIAILSGLLQTGIGIVFMCWILPYMALYIESIHVTDKVTEVEASNESTSVLFRIWTSYLLHLVSIVLRVYNIVRASKLSEIFDEINRVDSILRITKDYSKASRRRILRLVVFQLLICWIVQIPFYCIVIYSKFYSVLFYHVSLSLVQFTITSIEWAQMIFFVLLKRRYSFLNEKLNLIYTSVKDRNHSQESMITTRFDDNEIENDHWSVPRSIDNSIENGGRNKIWNYLNNVKKTFLAENPDTSKINKRKIIVVSESSCTKKNSTRDQKKMTSWQFIPSNILRISTAQELEILRIAHQELSTTLMRIRNFFRFRIHLTFCTDVISLLDNLHYITQQFIQPWKGNTSLWLLLRHPAIFMIWTLEYFTRITCIVWSNSSTNSEAKKTSLHLERLQVSLFARRYQEALEELGYFKRYMYSEVAFSSSGGLIDFHGSLILRVIDISINYVFLILQQTFRKN